MAKDDINKIIGKSKSQGLSYQEIEKEEGLKGLVHDNRKKEIDAENADIEKDLRQSYAKRIFILICVYFACIFLIIVANGFEFIPFIISDMVLSVILGTTTVNVLGLLYVVVKYLFPQR